MPCYEFCLGSLSKDFTEDEMSEVPLRCKISQLMIARLKKNTYLILVNI